MATQLLTLETAFFTGLTAVQYTAALSAADMATMEQLVVDDQAFRSQTQNATPIQSGVVFTADTVTTALTGLTSCQFSSPTGVQIGSIQPGHWLYGPNIPVGAQVISASGSTVHFSGSDTPLANQTQATFFTLAKPMKGTINREGQLVIPNRGVLKVLPGDVIAVDPSGWPFLLSQNAIDYSGTCWDLN